jgi:hypothetical protein
LVVDNEELNIVHTYSAYGLGIHSELLLPELVPAPDAKADIVIRFGTVDHSSANIVNSNRCFHFAPDKACYYWDGIVAYQAQNGNEIIIDPDPGTPESSLRIPLLGGVLFSLLYQRGLFVLHASAVNINGSVVAFLGLKGQGKSTMAATLYGRGHSLVSDDMLAVQIDGDARPTAIPGFPNLKIWPDSAASALGDDPENLPRLIEGYEKRARGATTGFSLEPLPLSRIFVLGSGPHPQIEPMPHQEAVSQMLCQTYPARVFGSLLQGEAASVNFRQCISLINKVPVYWLRRHRSLEALQDVAQLVEDNLASSLADTAS